MINWNWTEIDSIGSYCKYDFKCVSMRYGRRGAWIDVDAMQPVPQLALAVSLSQTQSEQQMKPNEPSNFTPSCVPKGKTYIWWVVSLLCATVKHREMNYSTLSPSLSPRQSAIEFKVRNCLHFSGLRPMQRVPYGMHIMQSIAINFMRMWVVCVEYVVKTSRKWSRRRKTEAEDEPKIQLFPLQLQKCR